MTKLQESGNNTQIVGSLAIIGNEADYEKN